MHRIQHNIKRILFGALAAGLLLSACNNANPAKPDDNTGTKPQTPSQPVEKEMLNFKVRALTVDNTAAGFRVYRSVQQVQVAVTKGATTVTKRALIAAIRAKDPEMAEAGEFQLYKTNKVTADIYSEYDAGLKNNASVFIGKDTYTKKVSLIVKSITTVKDGYRPVADYKDGKEIVVSVSHSASQDEITRQLQEMIKANVRMGANHDILYQLFANEKASLLAYDRHFVHNGMVYIGKKSMKPTITLKAVAARTPRIDGYIYSGVTSLDETRAAERQQPLVPDTELTLDEELDDRTSMAEVRKLFEAKIRARLDAAWNDSGSRKLSDEEYLSRCRLFSDKDGKITVKDEDFKDGATIYVGKKLAKIVQVKIFNVTVNTPGTKIQVSNTAGKAITYATPAAATSNGYDPINALPEPIELTFEADLEGYGHTLNYITFVDKVRELLKSNYSTYFSSADTIALFHTVPVTVADATEAQVLKASDMKEFTTSKDIKVYVAKK